VSPDKETAPTTFRPAIYVATHPERPAVVTTKGRVVTFGELEERSCRLAQALYAHGLREGDHVAVLMLNDDRTHEVAFGLQRSGLYYTMVNTHLTAEEAAYIVNDCGAHTVISSAGLNALSANMIPHTPAVDLRLVVDGGSGAPLPDSHTSYDNFLATHPGTPLEDEREGFSMLYSSGTTGHPKGVRRALTHDAFGTSATLVPMLSRIMDFKEGDVYLSPAPLYHSAPLVWSMTVHRMGGTVVVMDKFDPTRCLELIEEHKVTHAQFVPTMFVRMLKLSDEERAAHDVSSLRSVVHAAAPCAPEVKRRMIEWWGPIIHEYYSGTEGLGMTWITSQEALTHPGSVGRAVWGEAHVLGEDGEEVPAGTDGVVYFSSRARVTFEYNGDPEKTRQSFNDKVWATLWDVGHLDDEGYLYLTDRKQFMIVSGGVNIYPQEIEAVLVLHPAVADVAVFGVPEPEMGEEVKAVVQPAPGFTAGPELADEILAFCRDHLSHYKCPRTVDFVDQLPRGENGKLYKKPLRDAYWASSAPSTT
jgi:acyl-CoA synthetase (AMP-forming)/AMP-acid ligase II